MTGRGLFVSLRGHWNFRVYFMGQSVSMVGTWMQTVAVTWLVLRLTHSAVDVGIVALCQFLPSTAFGLFAGAVLDRFELRRVVIATQLSLAIIAVVFAALIYAGSLLVGEVYALSLIGGCVTVIDNPGRQTLVYRLVGRQDLANAVGLSSGVQSASRIVGPALGGIVIAVAGVGPCFVANAVSYIPALLSLALIRKAELHSREPPPRMPRPVVGRSSAIGFVRRTPSILIVLLAVLSLSTLSLNMNVLVPLLAKLTLHGDSETFGLLSAFLGAGSTAGALTAAAWGHGRWSVILLSCAGVGSFELLLAWSSSVGLVVGGLFCAGLCMTVATSCSSANVQLNSPEVLQANIVAFYFFALLAGSPFGGLLSGWLAALGGTKLALTVAGGAALGTCLLAASARAVMEARPHLRGRGLM